MDPRDIRPHMDVIGSDGTKIGRVDHVDGDRIKLTREGSRDGEHHHIPLSQVSRVDSHVHVTTTAAAIGTGAAAAGTASATSNPIPPIRNPAVEGSHPRRNYYLPWVLLGIALLAILLLATNSCDRDDDRREIAAPAEQSQAAAPAAPLAVETVKLRNGKSVDLEPNTLNYTLHRYLESSEPTPRAFVFENLNFETASAAIRAQDVATIDTLAQILRAYPDARGRIVGYTDARGSAAANEALGELRAQAVAAALVEKGVDARRLEAVSGGEGAPKSSNRSREGQAENRRTEFVVLDK